MKRYLSVILCLILAVVMLLSGCAAGNSGADAKANTESGARNANNEPEAAAGTFPIVKEKKTFRLFAPQQASVENMDTNDTTKWYEEKTNIHIQWELVPVQNLVEKRNLVLASNDLPDAFFYSSVTNPQQVIYGEQGILIPLNDLIDKYAVEIKKMFDETPGNKEMVTTPNGKIYALPEVNEAFHVMYQEKMWMYQPWLDKLGLKTPTTTDEFYEVLKAFKEKDPNGNGKADEIPLAGCVKGNFSEIDGFLMNAFIYNDDRDRLIVKDGKIDVPYNKPEWKAGLDYIRKLYAEGLIYPASFTQDAAQLKQIGENPDVNILGAAPGQWCGQWTENYGPSGRYIQYATIPPLKGPNGFQVCGYYPYSSVNPGQFAITNACKNPDLMFRWVDGLYSEEAALRITAGVPDRDWRPAKQGELGLDGKQGIYVNLTQFGKVQNANWQGFSPRYRPSRLRLGQVPNRPDHQEILLYNESKKNYEGKGPKEVMPLLYFTEEQSGQVADIGTTIKKHIEEFDARYIIGDLKGASDWDNYVKELDRIGVAKLIKIYQDAYDAKYKKK